MCQCNSDLFNNSPLISFSFFHSVSFSHLKPSLQSPLFALFFFFLQLRYLSLSLFSTFPPLFPLSPFQFSLISSASPFCHLTHVPMEQNTSLIALLLIYNRTERTGQSLKGLVNFRLRHRKKRRVGGKPLQSFNTRQKRKDVKE